LILSFLLPALKPGTSFGAGALCSFAVAFAAVVSEQSFHYWFNWAVISVVEVPLSLVWITTTILRKRTSEVPMRRIDGENGEEAVGELDSRGRPLKPRIPEHEMLHPFGEGSYGQVWLAKSVFDRYRAVKIVCRNHFKDPKPFDQELHGIQVFEPISRSHEGLVDILQIGYRKTAGYFYYIMELAEDLDLGGRIDPVKYTPRTLAKEVNKRGRISCAETVHIGIILAGALDYLHCQGLVHRDIKPSNIIFVNGIVKLADIGTVTRSNEAFSLVGTEGFYPPEGPGQPQGDIYSLGKVLYEISMGLNSQRCFPALPNELRNDPDREHLVKLNEIILRACHKDPIRRYASAAKLQGDLKRLAKRIGTDAN
jgi:serine/threonine protein kinase